MIRHTALTIGEFLEEIDSLEGIHQEQAIKEYLSISGMYSRFIIWYAKNNFKNLSDELNYVFADDNNPSKISDSIVMLEDLSRFPMKTQCALLEQMMTFLSPLEMLVMEAAINRELKEKYPNIQWDFFEKIFKIKIES